MQRIKATDWRRLYYSEHGRPSETWVKNQLRDGELPGEKTGGIWFVHVCDGTVEPDYGSVATASNDAEIAAATLIEDWMNGSTTAQPAAQRPS